MNSGEAGPAVETGIEAEDRLNFHALHCGDVNSITCGEVRAVLRDFAGTKYIGLFYSEHVINDFENRLQGRVDGFTPVNGSVPVQNFLQDFSVGSVRVSAAN